MLKKIIELFPLRWRKKMKFLPQEWFVEYLYEYHTGKKLNLKNPVEFNQKIQWYKVYFRLPILTKLVDKYAVREFVKEKIGEQYLNKCYGVYNRVSEIDFSKLPRKFVLKATQASSYNMIVTDKSKLNKLKTKLRLFKWLHTNQYYRTGMEWAYKNVKPRIIAEKYLENDESKSLIDYKFYCFDGEIKIVLVIFEKEFKVYKYLDAEWNLFPFAGSKKIEYDGLVDKPSNFEEMKQLAKKLSKGFPFVRVDFYSIQGKSIFGEMTFYPTDGRKDFRPDEYNKIIGDWFKLPKIPKGEKYITKLDIE
jgi:hypothetical protein